MLRHFVRALKPMALGLKVITMVSSGDEGAAPVASLGISDLDAGGEISMLDWFEFDETCIYFPVDDALLGLSLEIEIGTSRGRLTVVS